MHGTERRDREARGPAAKRWRRGLGVAAVVVTTLLATIASVAVAPPAGAQGWQWPWSEPQRPPVPREPVYRAPAQPGPPPVAQPGPALGTQGRSSVCLQLEQRLVQETQRGGAQPRDQLPRIEADIRQNQRTMQQSQMQLERQDCFEYFLFTKSLRRTRQCVDISRQLEGAQRALQDLEVQRQQITTTMPRSYQDEIVRELARNSCGAAYQQEAQKRANSQNPFSSLWQDEDSGASAAGNQFGKLPFATYRTICVRLCDGYFFPVSFSTLPNHFQRDAEACLSKCAAPVELYYYPNPGGAMEQAMSVGEQKPYTSLRTAFRYRKELVQGCSCKQAEFVPGSETPQAASRKRADATPAAPSAAAQFGGQRPVSGR